MKQKLALQMISMPILLANSFSSTITADNCIHIINSIMQTLVILCRTLTTLFSAFSIHSQNLTGKYY